MALQKQHVPVIYDKSDRLHGLKTRMIYDCACIQDYKDCDVYLTASLLQHTRDVT